MSDLGDYLKKLRGKVSLREAAKRSGISHSYINSLEVGSHPRTGAPINPTPDILRSLAKAYNHSYDDLMIKAGYSNIEKEPSIEGLTPDQKKAADMYKKITDPVKQQEAISYMEFLLSQQKEKPTSQ